MNPKSTAVLFAVALISATVSGLIVWAILARSDKPLNDAHTGVIQQTSLTLTPVTNAVSQLPPSPVAATATAVPPPATTPLPATIAAVSPALVSPGKQDISAESSPQMAESQPLNVAKLAAQIRPAVALLSIFGDNGKLVRTGTAFFTSRDGRLVTNWHVIEGAVNANAKLENGATYTVTGIHNSAPELDLVLLQAEATDVPFLVVSQKPLPEVGARIAVIGSPLGLEGTVSEGIISGQRALSKKDRLLQMTAPVSPGSSGSPVVDRNGEVIGVATFVLRESQALNFARPADYVAQLLEKTAPDSEPKPLWARSTQPQNPATALTDFDAVDKALAENDFINALKILNTLAPRHSEEAILWFKFGFVYDKLGLYEDSVTAYEKALKVLPTNGVGWVNLGISLSKLKRWKEAAKAGREGIKIVPDHPQAWALLGFVAFEENSFREAVSAFEKATQLKPDEPENWRWLSICYSRVGNVTKMHEADSKWKSLRAVNPPGNPAPIKTERFTQLVMQSIMALEQNDVAVSMEKYADRVNYYRHGIVDRNFILADLNSYHERWPVIKVRLSSPVEVTDTPNPIEKRVVFTYEYEVSSARRNRVASGTARNEWIVSTFGDELRIVSEDQQVTRRR